ncbi:hypothetical protein BC830DRAFT_1169920 [Chytriomyces sp. MP71]|nr:hypothetical protein BC830DRAFT_1169920 [Chytriomyces sp. MP71]
MIFNRILSIVLAATTIVTAAPAPTQVVPSDAGLQLMHGRRKNQGIQRTGATSPHLTDYGGPVIPNVEVHPIFYGDANFQRETNAFYAGVTQSSWFDLLGQYNVGRGSAVAGISVPADLGSLDDVKDIQSLLTKLVQQGTIAPTANTYFPIHFAPGISITQGGQASCQAFCAYHGTLDVSGLGVGIQYLYYGVIPDQGGSCAGGCGSDPSAVNNMFSVASHELAEACTDAAVGVAAGTALGPPLAWYDGSNGEIGDICNAQQGTTMGGDGASYVIQKQWSNADNACVAFSSIGGTVDPPPKTTAAPEPQPQPSTTDMNPQPQTTTDFVGF